MAILETGDTALVLAKTVVSAKNLPATERKATYVFKRGNDNRWVCAIDNSYGHDLLEANANPAVKRDAAKARRTLGRRKF